MKFRSLYTILFALLSVMGFSQNELFEEANRALENGSYKQALIGYGTLEKEGLRDADLFYNMGNAYYHLEDIGNTILYYEKALKFAPGLKDAKHNLQLTYLKSAEQIEPLPQLFIVEWWQRLLHKHTASTWAKRGVFLVWLSMLLLILFRWKKWRWSQWLGIGCLCLGFAYVFLAWQKDRYMHAHTFAIVMDKEVSLKESPNSNGTVVLKVYEGVKLEIVDQVDDWFQISLEDGTTAWLLKSSIKSI